MNLRTLARRSLRHYFRSQLGVLAGVTLAAAVLIGALAVGDSVKESLKERALERLPSKSVAAISSGDRYFTQFLVNGLLSYDLMQRGKLAFPPRAGAPPPIANALVLPGMISRQDGGARANQVSVIGVNSGAFFFGHGISSNQVWLSQGLAEQLSAKMGDAVVLRIHKPSALSQDAVISPRDDTSVALRLSVGGIVPGVSGGNLSLLANQSRPLNAFVSLHELAQNAGMSWRANLILAQSPVAVMEGQGWRYRLGEWFLEKGYSDVASKLFPTVSEPSAAKTVDYLNERLSASWTLADAELDVRPGKPEPGLTGGESIPAHVELITSRIFLEPAAVRAALTNDSAIRNPQSAIPVATPLLTYLVNGLAHGGKLTPYSMVTAAGAPYTPADLKDDEIVVNQWLADDLGVKPGDSLALTYYRVDAGTQLIEHTNTFRVHSIVPLAGLHADRTLMPEFPGLSKAESTHDWDAGFDLVHTIRDQDEAYWKQYRGTPKAFITLAAGQKLWANRFGELTAIRWFVSPPSPRPSPPGRGGNAPATDNSTGQTPPAVGAASANAAQSSAAQPVESTRTQPASPSPGGEGRGEGGRTTNLSVTELSDAITARIRANLNPADVGLVWRPVREEALRAAESGTGKEFGGLMIGFSFFLITSALLLTAMLFRFALEQRTTEVGILLALGWPAGRVRGLLFREGLALSVLGTLLGAVLGIYYAKGVLWGLMTIWRDAIAGAGLEFHLTPVTLITGITLSIAVAAGTLFLALRQQAKRPARELLNEGANESALCMAEGVGRKAKLAAVIASVLAAGMVAAAWATRETKPEMFFGAGALLLIAGLLWARVWIRSVGQAASLPTGFGGTRASSQPALRSLALRALARQPSRSLGTVALLASAAFLIVAVAANKLDATRHAERRSSGTGGFALWGESSLPVIQDLNTRKGQEVYGLNPGDLKGVSFVQLRVRDGDDASCLNLNRAQRPRLLGVKPDQLAGRGAFTFTKVLDGSNVTYGWQGLGNGVMESGSDGVGTLQHSNAPALQHSVPIVSAIGDAASIQWALKTSVGGTIDYVDERGRPFKVRIVGAVANSILQGNLIIAENDFERLFPSESGYRGFLVDVADEVTRRTAPATKPNPPPHVGGYEAVSSALSRALQDVGLELTPTTRRLAQFNSVQNTYLNTFQILGGLGLLLGSVGLGVVVLRNVHERRGELGLMLALGFERAALKRLVLFEHGALLLVGLAVGIVAALVAVLPALGSPGADFPWQSLTVTLGLVLANGLIWTVWATARSLRGRLVDSLRDL